jgi:hypothetical protein
MLESDGTLRDARPAWLGVQVGISPHAPGKLRELLVLLSPVVLRATTQSSCVPASTAENSSVNCSAFGGCHVPEDLTGGSQTIITLRTPSFDEARARSDRGSSAPRALRRRRDWRQPVTCRPEFTVP